MQSGRARMRALIGAGAAALLLGAADARAAVFDVNVDAAADNGLCEPTPGTCTFSEALGAAADPGNPGIDDITFSIGAGNTADLDSSAIPDITTPVRIDGRTQSALPPAAPPIDLDGANIVFGPGAAGSEIRGFAIHGNPADAGVGVLADDVTVEFNYIGLEPDGITPSPNGSGVSISTSATVANNVIAANTGTAQIFLNGAAATARSTLEGNLLGLTASGNAIPAGGGGSDGVSANGFDGTPAGPLIRDNVIAGVAIGIFLPAGNVGTEIQGNRIGTNAAGTAVLGIPGRGIWFDGGTVDIEPSPTRPNVITGIGQEAIWIGGGAPAPGPRALIRDTLVGTLADGAPLGPGLGNGGDGIRIAPGAPVRLDIEGGTIAGSTGDGIRVETGTDVRVSGTTITRNQDDGIEVAPAAGEVAVTGATITANGDGTLVRPGFGAPAIASATTSGGNVRLTGSHTGLLPGRVYRIDVYRPDVACVMRDAYGSGLMTTNGAGAGAFDFEVGPRAGGALLAATATLLDGATPVDTSELRCATVAFQPLPPAPAPPPTPTPPGPTPPDGPGPVNGQTVSGTVKVRLPNGQVVDPKSLREIPLGSQVDATDGRIRITGNMPAGPGDAVFYGGEFVLRRDPADRIELQLAGRLTCPKATARGAQKRKRKLWGDGKGNFRVSGKHSATVVRGTVWSVEDRCDGTLTEVRRGRVDVRDYALGTVASVAAGKRYLAEDRPLPRRGRTVNVVPDTRATVRLANGSTRTITEFTQLPATAAVDATRSGGVRVVSAGDDVTQAATFTQGAFRLAGQRGTTLELVLADPPARARAAQKRKRKLWGDGEGDFRVKGKHSATVVRGTRWLVEETAAGTVTRVVRGTVTVEDFTTRRTVTLGPGGRYVAKP